MINYKRVILKLSGEALADKENKTTLKAQTLLNIADIIAEYKSLNVEVGIVVGAGNIFRGKLAKSLGLDSSDADYMGMMGTVVNAMALKSVLINKGVNAIVLSALEVEDIAPKHDKELAKKLLSEGYVVIFAAGTGKPNFTTDTCAALRAIDIDADAILMAKEGVDGVYSGDPRIDLDAKIIKSATYKELISLKLGVMDLSALKVLEDTNIIMRVFSMNDLSNFKKVLENDKIGTIIRRKL